MANDDDRQLTSEEVATKLNVSIGWVYKLRVDARRGNGFPNPVGFQGRSPLYSEAAIDAYIAARADRSPSDRGRKSRTELTIDDDTFAGRLRRAIANGDGRPDAPTQAALIALLGLNVVTFGERMRGRTRWKESELTLIRSTVGLDTADANEAVTLFRANRGRTS